MAKRVFELYPVGTLIRKISNSSFLGGTKTATIQEILPVHAQWKPPNPKGDPNANQIPPPSYRLDNGTFVAANRCVRA